MSPSGRVPARISWELRALGLRCRYGTMFRDMKHTQMSTELLQEKPEWIRLPAPGHRCRHTGLSRSSLNELVLPAATNDWKPPVKSVVLRKRGAIRGIRLIGYDSLMDYLATLNCTR